jgi:dienelactone hydrolase
MLIKYTGEKMSRFLLISVILSVSLLITGCCDRVSSKTNGQKVSDEKIQEKRAEFLEHLLKTYSSDKDGKPQEVPIWESWLRKSGELPPDFDELEANAIPPELLRFQNGKTVANPRQWEIRKQEIRKALEQYMFGNWPPPPPKMAIKYQESNEEETELYIKTNVQLYFAPSVTAVEYVDRTRDYSPRYKRETRGDYTNFDAAVLNVVLYIPKGKGPFPAIIQWGIGRQISNQEIESLKRGYIYCRFDINDADYFRDVYPDYECNQIEWWAYAASRCVDLLYSRDDIDRSKIAVYGHSRSGKTILLAAVMDDRINAIIDSHPGTGAGSFNLWRYASDKYGGETLENGTRRFQYWNNPRMRFFIGRENKMPFDSHFLLALVAPRPCLMGTGEHDDVGEAWGDQQCYLAVKKVYQLLGGEQKLGFYASPDAHQVTPQMVNDYLDWLDMQFGRKPFDFSEKLIYTYTFDGWKKITGEEFDIKKFPEKDLNDILLALDGKEIKEKEEWGKKADQVRNQIKLIIGDLPAYEKIQKVKTENERSYGNNLKKAEIPIDDKLIAHITWPADNKNKIPVVIYLHAYLDANGYNWSRGYGYTTSVGERLAQNGFLAIEFDQFGYGLRNRDSDIEFYAEHKNQSALGVMIRDVSKIIDALSLIDWVDKDKIMVAGYSLGGMVGLYAAVFDSRIQAVASTCGFGSMRLDVHGDQTEGIKRYSHLRPTIPRLGLFLGNEKRIPYDFHEVLALIAPRPVFILAPKLDQDWYYEDVEICYNEAVKVFNLYGRRENINLVSPDDFNRYPPEYQEIIISWLTGISK